MPFARTIAAAVAILGLATIALGGTLKPGDAAPTLGKDVEWLQGGPIPQWEPGHVYVLDFWATWCAPCVQSIPTLTAIHDAYREKNVHVVGVAIWPTPGMAPTDDFVARQGERMPYPVCEAIGERVAERFMYAAGQDGIPTTMIVDGSGALVWIGHPEAMDFKPVLKKVVAGEFDAAAAKAMAAKKQQAEKLLVEANRLASQGDWDGALRVIDEIIAIDPESNAHLAVVKFQRLLITLERVDEGYAFGHQIVGTLIKDNPYLLELVARFTLEAPGLQRRDTDLAMMAAQRAVELTNGEDANALATLATAYMAVDKAEKAIALIDKAHAMAQAQSSPLLAEIAAKRDRFYAQAESVASKN